MKNERKFWEALTQAENPDWDVNLSRKMSPGQMNLAAYKVFVYVIDAQTGWIAGGSTTVAQMQSTHAHLSSLGERSNSFRDAAAALIVKHGKNMPDSQSRETITCITASVGAITQTAIYEKLTGQGSPAGHWLYIAYNTPRGSTFGRAVFFRHPALGFAPPQDIRRVAMQAIKRDTQDKESSVYSEIRSAGGALINSDLRPTPVALASKTEED